MKCSYFSDLSSLYIFKIEQTCLPLPILEISKFLVTQININDKLKSLQKVTIYKQPLYKNQTTHRKTPFTNKAPYNFVRISVQCPYLREKKKSKYKCSKYAFFFSGDQTQGLAHATHTLYH